MQMSMTESNPQPLRRLYLRKTEDNARGLCSFRPPLRGLVDLLGALLVIAIFLRASILGIVLPTASPVLFAGTYTVLVLALVLLFIKKGGKAVFLPGGFLLLAVATSCLLSPMRDQSLQKGAGWLLLFATAGPCFVGPSYRRFRAIAWAYCRILILFVGLASVLWYALRVPTLGTGPFSGVMTHCMLTGPLSAVACVLAILQAVRRKSWWWAAVGLLCVVPTLASGSRSALLSLMAGILAILVMVRPLRIVTIVCCPLFLLFLVAKPGSHFHIGDDSSLGELTATLRDKGVVNTREELWESRFAEFKAYPAFGMGVGIGIGEGVEWTSGRINVEPGSSYFAILSMTGTVGALGFLALFLVLAKDLVRNRRHLPAAEMTELLSVLVLLSVHAIAEGWILAVGNSLGVIFWLALGRSLDCTSASPNSNIVRGNP